MRRRSQRFERVRFRRLDDASREALLSVLARMPVLPAGTAAPDAEQAAVARRTVGAPSPGFGSAGDALAAMARILAAAEPLQSPLAAYEARLEDGVLRLLQSRLRPATPGGDPAGRDERGLAEVRRLGEDRWEVAAATGGRAGGGR